MYIVYGIPNCNTVKKAIDWLQENKVEYQFHDYKKKGITATKLKSWSKQQTWQNLLNKKGTTWRGLDETIQQTITNEPSAIVLMQEKTSIIKRPLIELNDTVVALGFDEAAYKKVFSK